MAFKTARQRKYVMAKLNSSHGGGYGPLQSRGTGERHTTTEPIMPKKYRELLDKSSDILSSLPEPNAQKASPILKGLSILGENIKVQKTMVPVKEYQTKNGTKVEAHKRVIEKEITI